MKIKLVATIVFFVANVILCILCAADICKALFQESSHINPIMDIGLGLVFAWNAFESFKGIKRQKYNQSCWKKYDE